MLNAENSRIVKKTSPKNRFDCAVKYSNRFSQPEYPSFTAVKKLKNTPNSDANITIILKISDKLVRNFNIIQLFAGC